MNIALATHGFAYPGGSETYVLTVAEQLQRLGHEVVIFSAETGPMSDFAAERGLMVSSELRVLEGCCDAIIVQDSILSYRLAERYPSTPQLFRAPSDLHDFQLPPALPGLVRAVVVCSDRVGRRIASLATRYAIHRLRQPIDTQRFMPAGAPAATPRKAVLLGNYLRGERLQAMRAALDGLGVASEQIGVGGELTCTPEHAIWDADIVVAKGRAALEGMACGRAVFVYDQFGGDGWVTGERYRAMEADNFAGHSGPPIATRAELEDELLRYNAGMGTVNRELAITHHSARAHSNELCELLEDIDPPSDLAGAPLRELSRLVRMQWLVELRAIAFEEAGRLAREETERTRVENSQLAQERDSLRTHRDELTAHSRALADELERCQDLCRTQRVRIGLRLGEIADIGRRALRRR